jgi:hypothetical protein
MLLSLFFLGNHLRKTLKENKRLERNEKALLSDVSFYKTKSGESAASVLQLELTRQSLSNSNLSLKDEIKKLNIKLKRVVSTSRTATKSNYNIKTLVKDSIIYKDRVIIDTVAVVRYNDEWITFDGIIKAKEFLGKIETRDTLIQVVHRIPYRFLFFRYGTKAIRQEIVSKNPYSRINYSEYIKLVR